MHSRSGPASRNLSDGTWHFLVHAQLHTRQCSQHTSGKHKGKLHMLMGVRGASHSEERIGKVRVPMPTSTSNGKLTLPCISVAVRAHCTWIGGGWQQACAASRLRGFWSSRHDRTHRKKLNITCRCHFPSASASGLFRETFWYVAHRGPHGTCLVEALLGVS